MKVHCLNWYNYEIWGLNGCNYPFKVYNSLEGYLKKKEKNVLEKKERKLNQIDAVLPIEAGKVRWCWKEYLRRKSYITDTAQLIDPANEYWDMHKWCFEVVRSEESNQTHRRKLHFDSLKLRFWWALKWLCNWSSRGTSSNLLHIILNRWESTDHRKNHCRININRFGRICVRRFSQNSFLNKTPNYQQSSKHAHPPGLQKTHKCSSHWEIASRKNLSPKNKSFNIIEPEYTAAITELSSWKKKNRNMVQKDFFKSKTGILQFIWRDLLIDARKILDQMEYFKKTRMQN